MNNEWDAVREFHIRFNHPCSDVPKELDLSRSRKRYKWMMEELDEFLNAEDMIEQADAMIDLMYFALGTLVEMGIKPDELFKIVHIANMNKLWEDGKPHYAKDGKTIKPADWEDPRMRLEQAIKKQQNNEVRIDETL